MKPVKPDQPLLFDDIRHCGNPGCARLFRARETGRPRLTCSDRCRKARNRFIARRRLQSLHRKEEAD